MTHMQQEIEQTPFALSRSINKNREQLNLIAKKVRVSGITNIIVGARGSSMNAGFILKTLVETTNPHLRVSFEIPSLATLYKVKRDLSKTLYVVVSQSGASRDTFTMLKQAISNGAVSVAITNNSVSSCAKKAHYHIDLCAGPEQAVAATKTFSCEIFALLQLARSLEGKLESLDSSNLILGSEQILSRPLPDVSKELLHSNGVFALSRGVTECVARECGLKMMECCYKFVYAGSTNEFHHGPKALIKSGVPVVLIAPSGSYIKNVRNYVKTAKTLQELEAYTIAITDIEEVAKFANQSISLPKHENNFEAIFSTLCVQQLVLALSLELGLNPDKPRNLDKVTVT